MAYEITIHYTDTTSDPAGKQPFTVYPGETNTTTASIDIVGQGTMEYGRTIMNNLIHLLENFCSSEEPEAGTRGQLWFDADTNTLKVYTFASPAATNKTWETVAGVAVSTVEPTDKSVLWYDTSSADPTQWQLKIFNSAPSINAWVSVASRYVQRSGDAVTGDLTFTVTDKGLVGTASGYTNRITPTTTRGPAIYGGRHATVVINNASATPTGGEFVIGTGTTLTDAVSSSGRLLSVSDAGVVTIHKNTLSMNSRKITDLAAGTVGSDGVNFAQLTSLQTNLQDSIDDINTELDGVQTSLNNKVSKTGDTMSGALVINNTLYTGGRITSAGGLTVSAGTSSFAGNVSMASELSVTGASTLAGAVTMNGNATIVGAAQLNSTLTVNGATQLKSTVAITGAATLSNNLTVGGAASVTGTLTLTGLATMNQARTAITNAKHLATKEYVDYQLSTSGSTGQVGFFATSWAPTGWLKANGAAVSRTTYANLFATIGTYYGAGDGATTFNLPDLRGEFIRCLDEARGVDWGRALGSVQLDALQTITGTVGDFNTNHPTSSGAFYLSDGGSNRGTRSEDNQYLIHFDSSRVTRGAAETRPRNVALLACIKF